MDATPLIGILTAVFLAGVGAAIVMFRRTKEEAKPQGSPNPHLNGHSPHPVPETTGRFLAIDSPAAVDLETIVRAISERQQEMHRMMLDERRDRAQARFRDEALGHLVDTVGLMSIHQEGLLETKKKDSRKLDVILAELRARKNHS